MGSYSRREFLRVSGFGAAAALGAGECSGGSGSWGQLPANELELRIDGVDGEFCFLHVTDSHLCHWDARDLKLKEHMAKRTKTFREPTEETASFVRTVRKIRPDFVANTGDFLDVPTAANIDAGRPCIIFMHIPVGVESLLPATIAKWRRPIVLGGKMSSAKRKRWQIAMEAQASTLEFCEMVNKRAEIKAIFAGHLHFDHIDELGGGGRQYVTGPGYQGRYRFVRVRGT